MTRKEVSMAVRESQLSIKSLCWVLKSEEEDLLIIVIFRLQEFDLRVACVQSEPCTQR